MILKGMEAAKLIHDLLDTDGQIKQVRRQKLFTWVRLAVDIFTIKMRTGGRVYLLKPKKVLDFGQISNIVRIVEKDVGSVSLFIADEVNPKFRALFVKNNVPFIYRDTTIFAPMLGMKLFNYKTPKLLKNIPIDNELSPFELKLVAGFLTNFVTASFFNLNQIQKSLAKRDYHCSKSKLAKAINHLVELGYLIVRGSGPHRYLRFKDRNEVWDIFKDQSVKRFYRSIKGYHMVGNDFIFSGESALSRYSRLAEKRNAQVAITSKDLKAIENEDNFVDLNGVPFIVYDVFKEPPRLFSMHERHLNAIELYCLLKSEPDERVQISVDEMIIGLGLKV